MIVAAFKYKVNPEFQEEFEGLYSYARKHVSMIEGYDGHEVYNGENGHNMLVVYFKDKDSFLIWDEHPEHKKYKERGKTEIFESYDVSVGEVFERHTK
ncbi:MULTISPECIES: antibiotic biosynthesis monooxygenase family protein [Bacteroidota]|jgi:heme-degrading monooxygenase HmoA|uniref:antibiotic biosynthesis monooxygenase family protein n=1 Tax=Bacteroidota TaxID=976 RepID=UPI0008A335A7|nr:MULTISPECIES: antibiotic biosynthesis monooxygenase [Bacteroidota]HCU43937.1 antibiotic biosynthesis monooxygenase [Sphingobacterium sp.]MDN3607162.1 antibiotic biosynthesis monooxygenase [Kaistella yonginensis]MDP2455325.1 antibiotic biosynthesis monooxygenase [Kaistella sp. SH11-4b]MDP2458233.1 antibiotic biosynthesis monooxygenase [Kaistella sp. SH40-3]MDP2461141.1 antibiotic biosynthesis monooxygenase [Kaistella sp. SH19-2b]